MSTVDILIRLLLIALFFTTVFFVFAVMFPNSNGIDAAQDRETSWNRHVQQALFVSRRSK